MFTPGFCRVLEKKSAKSSIVSDKPDRTNKALRLKWLRIQVSFYPGKAPFLLIWRGHNECFQDGFLVYLFAYAMFSRRCGG